MIEVNRGRQNLSVYGQGSENRFNSAGPSQKVSCHGLGGADGDRIDK